MWKVESKTWTDNRNMLNGHDEWSFYCKTKLKAKLWLCILMKTFYWKRSKFRVVGLHQFFELFVGGDLLTAVKMSQSPIGWSPWGPDNTPVLSNNVGHCWPREKPGMFRYDEIR